MKKLLTIIFTSLLFLLLTSCNHDKNKYEPDGKVYSYEQLYNMIMSRDTDKLNKILKFCSSLTESEKIKSKTCSAEKLVEEDYNKGFRRY